VKVSAGHDEHTALLEFEQAAARKAPAAHCEQGEKAASLVFVQGEDA
jgi:hypothetical protein